MVQAVLSAVYLVTNFLNDLLFIFQRVNWLSVVDILLVTLIFFILLIHSARYTGIGFAARCTFSGNLVSFAHQSGRLASLFLAHPKHAARSVAGHPGHFCSRNPTRIGTHRARWHISFPRRQGNRPGNPGYHSRYCQRISAALSPPTWRLDRVTKIGQS